MPTSYQVADTDIISAHGTAPYALRIRDLPVGEKPREKLVALGPDALSVSELLAVVLGVGTRKEEVMAMSKRLIREYGESMIVRETNPIILARTLDVPVGKACQIVAALELGRRFFRTTEGMPVFIRTADQAFEYLKDMRELKKEHLRGLYLNNHFRLIHDEVISIGSLTANIVHPREVFRPALEHAAVAVILAHNHPSGDPSPSDADLEITKQLIEAGKILGISLLDHVIVAKHSWSRVDADYG